MSLFFRCKLYLFYCRENWKYTTAYICVYISDARNRIAWWYLCKQNNIRL